MATKVKTGSAKGANKAGQKPSSTSSSSRLKKTSNAGSAGAKQHKPAPRTASQKQKPKKRTYTDKELGLGALNGIVPSGVQKRANQKKGKTFVEDREQMDLIMKMVMAEKEGNIESKMMRARQMEEVREARKLEHERRAGEKREGLEERKRDIKDSKRKRRRDPNSTDAAELNGNAALDDEKSAKKPKKRVSFG